MCLVLLETDIAESAVYLIGLVSMREIPGAMDYQHQLQVTCFSSE